MTFSPQQSPYVLSSTVALRDYAAALASMQPRYGASGSLPTKSKSKEARDMKSKRSSAVHSLAYRRSPSPSSSSTQSSSAAMKDYSSALASLQSRYGASGGLPMKKSNLQEARYTKSGYSSTASHVDTLSSLSYNGTSPSRSSSTSSRFKVLLRKISSAASRPRETENQSLTDPTLIYVPPALSLHIIYELNFGQHNTDSDLHSPLMKTLFRLGIIGGTV